MYIALGAVDRRGRSKSAFLVFVPLCLANAAHYIVAIIALLVSLINYIVLISLVIVLITL